MEKEIVAYWGDTPIAVAPPKKPHTVLYWTLIVIGVLAGTSPLWLTIPYLYTKFFG